MRASLLSIGMLFTSCTSDTTSLSFVDVPALVHAEPGMHPELVVTLQAHGFDGPLKFRVDNFTADTVVEGEILDRATVTIRLMGCLFGSLQQGNFLHASTYEVAGDEIVWANFARADIAVVCDARSP